MKIPHIENFREDVRDAGAHAKGFVDRAVSAICLASLILESFRAGDQAATSSGKQETGPAQSDDIELLTTKELARRISYSTRQIQNFKLEDIPIPFTGKGRGTRFKLHEVVAWLDQRSRKQHETNRVLTVSNGKVPQAPIKTRLQAKRT